MLVDIPLSYAVPVAASALAYLNARWSVFYDAKLIGSLIKAMMKAKYADYNGHLNLFYVLENYALAAGTKNHLFMVYNGRTWTFHETYETVLRYGAWLQTVYDVKPKDIVAIDFMNSSTFLFFVLGLWSIGAVPAFINYNLSSKPLTHSVRVSTAKLLIVDEELQKNFPQEQLEIFASPDFREEGGSIETVFFTPDVEAQVLQTEALRVDDAVRGEATLRDMAALIYTSGTTGLPKPAIVSWKKCWVGSVFSNSWLNIGSTDRFFTASKFPLIFYERELTRNSACPFTTLLLLFWAS